MSAPAPLAGIPRHDPRGSPLVPESVALRLAAGTGQPLPAREPDRHRRAVARLGGLGTQPEHDRGTRGDERPPRGEHQVYLWEAAGNEDLADMLRRAFAGESRATFSPTEITRLGAGRLAMITHFEDMWAETDRAAAGGGA